MNSPSRQAFLGLGSNQGNRCENLQQAVVALAHHPDLEVIRLSQVYETQYVGPGTQDPYLNACLEIRTTLLPGGLLDLVKECEQRRGRPAHGHLLPRPLDIDILLFGGEVHQEPGLEIPHPRMRERAFVLVPLDEIASEEIFPDSGETVSAVCAKIRQKSGPWLRECKDCRLLVPGASASKEDWRAALAVYRR